MREGGRGWWVRHSVRSVFSIIPPGIPRKEKLWSYVDIGKGHYEEFFSQPPSPGGSFLLPCLFDEDDPPLTDELFSDDLECGV